MSNWSVPPSKENDPPGDGTVAAKTDSAQNPFDMSVMTAILKKVANSSNVIPTLPVGENEEAGVNGWNAKSAYNYDDFSDEKPATKTNGDDAAADDKPTWAASAAKYEWRDEYGEAGPRFELLEEQLFKGADKQHAGDNMAA
jgi:ATP-dependent RNA helicase DDX3X